MQQMTTSQARLVDPVLTAVAQGYKNAEMVGMFLFPAVPVPQRGGKIIAFNREDFLVYITLRTPGAGTRRVQFGYASQSFTLDQHALEAVVPWELQGEARAAHGLDLAMASVAKVQNVMALRLEYAQAALATTAANYAATNKATLAGVNQWSDYTGTSNPAKDIETAKEAIRSQIGKYPDTVMLPAAVMAKVRQHPSIIDRIKWSGREAATPQMLAALWGVERVVVGAAMYQDAAGAMQDVWGKGVVLAYTAMGSPDDLGEPSYGYTYRLEGAPYVEPAYEDKNAKCDVFPVTDECKPVMAAPIAGYLISAAVA